MPHTLTTTQGLQLHNQNHHCISLAKPQIGLKAPQGVALGFWARRGLVFNLVVLPATCTPPVLTWQSNRQSPPAAHTASRKPTDASAMLDKCFSSALSSLGTVFDGSSSRSPGSMPRLQQLPQWYTHRPAARIARAPEPRHRPHTTSKTSFVFSRACKRLQHASCSPVFGATGLATVMHILQQRLHAA